MNFIKKVKFEDTRKLIIFGIIKISYKKKKRLSTIKIKDLGENNLINIKTPSDICSIQDGGEIIIKGNNNKIIIGELTSFRNCHIELLGNNITFCIGKDSKFKGLYAVISGCKNGDTNVTIDDNFWNIENLQLFAGGEKNMNLSIGNNCLFSRNIAIYAGDGHKIFNNDGKIVNNPEHSIEIGDHVWIGHGVHICKGVKISDNSIVGMGSVVTKRFNLENVILAGNPAKIVKENINWER